MAKKRRTSSVSGEPSTHAELPTNKPKKIKWSEDQVKTKDSKDGNKLKKERSPDKKKTLPWKDPKKKEPATEPDQRKFKKPKNQPTDPPRLPTSTADEIDFPRGGGIQLTAYEQAEAKRDGAQEAERHLHSLEPSQPKPHSKKRTLSESKTTDSGKAKGKKRAQDEEPGSHIADAYRVEHLNHKRLIPGIKLAGMIIQVRPLELIVALPSHLLGHVPITEISRQYTQRLTETAEDDEGSVASNSDSDRTENALKGLDEMFTVGQWIRCSVIKTATEIPKGSLRASPLVRSALKVTLTIDPVHINSGIDKSDLQGGMTLTGAVKSIEDRGYIIDLGISVDSNVDSATSQASANNLTAFISFADATKATGVNHQDEPSLQWEVGQVIWCRINKLSENGATCMVSVNAQDISRSVLTAATNIDSILPLHMVSCLITSVIPGQGLNVTLLGFFKATIQVPHLECHSTAGVDLSEKFKVGQKLRARVLWDTIPSKNHVSLEGNESLLGPKIFSLSIFDHVVKLDTPGLPTHLQDGERTRCDKIDQLLLYPIGYTFQTVRIFRVDEEWGVYATCVNGEDGLPIEIDPPVAFAHIATISDSFLSCLSKDSGPYKVGTTHKARVTGVSPVDGVLQLTLQPSVVEQAYMRSEDIPIGALMNGTIKKLTATNLIVRIEGGHDAVVWPDHYSDVKHAHPEKKFAPGAKVKARVLYTNPDRDQIVLTLRKTLVRADEIITSYESASVGTCAWAMITKVEEKFMLIEFFGHTKGLVPRAEAEAGYVESMKPIFTPGRLVKVKIINVDVEKRRILASVKRSTSDEASKLSTVIDVGDQVSAFVTAIRNAFIQLDLRHINADPSSSEPVKGLISVEILAKKYDISPEALKNQLKAGDEVKDLIVHTKDKEKELLIVGYKSASIPQEQMTGPIRFIHDKNLVLNLRKVHQAPSSESYVEGFLPIHLLAEHRKTPIDTLKAQLSIGEEITGLRPIHKDSSRGLLIVGFPNSDPGKFSFTSPQPETLSVSDRVVGRIFNILDTSITLSLRKEGTEGYAKSRGIITPSQLAKHRQISEEQLRLELKPGDYIYDLIVRKKAEEIDCYHLGFAPSEKAVPTIELSVGDPVIGTIEAIHEKNVILSLQREGCETNGADVINQGLISVQVLAGHRNLNEKNLKQKLKEGQKVTKLVVKKTDTGRGLVIVGFASPHFPLPPSHSEFAVGKTLRVRVSGRDANGLTVTPVDTSPVEGRFLIDYTDTTDDYDEPSKYQDGSEITACVIQIDKKSLTTYLSVRPSDLNKLTNESLKSSVKDRPIRQWKNLRIGTAIRGFVQRVTDHGLMLQVGTNIRAQVSVQDLFDEDMPNWKSKFRIGQVVSGKIISLHNHKARVSLRENPSAPKGVPVWEKLQIGQILSTEVSNIQTYGMFLKVPKSKISGLCHRTQIYDDPKDYEEHKKDWNKAYSEGMKLKASIISLDVSKKKVSFAIKPSVVNPEANSAAEDLSPEVIQITDHDSDEDTDDDASHPEGSLLPTSNVDEAQTKAHPATVSIDFTEPCLPISTGFTWDANRSGTDNVEDQDEQSTDTDDAAERGSAEVTSDPTDQQSVDEIERLLKLSPNSSHLWIRLITIYIQKLDIPQARETAERALEAIHYREEGEKWKVWIALLNLENTYGTEEQFRETFKEASARNDTKTVYLKVAEIYSESGKTEKADEIYSQALKKYSRSSKVWTLYGGFCLKNNRPTDPSSLLSRSLKSLPQHKHVKTIAKFAQLQFKFGDPEKGHTLFEGLVDTYPKRLDLWNVYIDLHIKAGSTVETIRGLFNRMQKLKFNPKRMKSIFKKWLSFEQTHGDKESQGIVVQRAQDYVATLMSSSSNKQMEESDQEE
ncbi:rRNA bioproteinsis protein rrp5 [Puccinia graminis f. sp. tritici]|uniref:rRNA bioproteinsis protein rrp5 n=1 Tax=Puccinia graminis f. sp. tritici TaxID=56615 RepID=A0A5B0PUM8_PUCGR|nr:rRNA bioproteinsis protein rrp5 [Puccinia graminis f. sp. tritici]